MITPIKISNEHEYLQAMLVDLKVVIAYSSNPAQYDDLFTAITDRLIELETQPDNEM